MTALLSCREVSVSYGGVRALVDVDLDVEDGQLVGLIEPNGRARRRSSTRSPGWCAATVAPSSTAGLIAAPVPRPGPAR